MVTSASFKVERAGRQEFGGLGKEDENQERLAGKMD